MLFSIAALVAMATGSALAEITAGNCYNGVMHNGVKFTNGHLKPDLIRDNDCYVESTPIICAETLEDDHFVGYVYYKEGSQSKYKWIYRDGEFDQDFASSDWDRMHFRVSSDEDGDFLDTITNTTAFLPFRGELLNTTCGSEEPNFGDFLPEGSYKLYLVPEEEGN